MLPISEYQKLAVRDAPFVDMYPEFVDKTLWPFIGMELRRDRKVSLVKLTALLNSRLGFTLKLGSESVDVILHYFTATGFVQFRGEVKGISKEKLPDFKIDYNIPPAAMAETIVNHVIRATVEALKE